MSDVDPFDSFAARLRVAQKRSQQRPVSGGNWSAAKTRILSRSETIGVRLRFRRHGMPRAGEPYEALTDLQREAGKLDADGSVRIRVPLDAPPMTISVGGPRRFRVVLAISRDQPRRAK